ncbi:DUF305 domain-containing protein [Micromonospora sagamiensis]|uniref:Uncharacterized protein (DUF305 family) n=1 Tax=Micromonospora sagamiensis TaxID=47875 RepID=A0A562WG78_9ACTN|nr:DUF305 domain-containing protein [Micromonospora sagamiensis]TWJ29283.1 uncharacterized protein (DUF305 family) [Micromonospora sagamiensis]BCL17690.1 hypothetical protein GCM10017556_54290 [Micromonospora sagamiensis]
MTVRHGRFLAVAMVLLVVGAAALLLRFAAEPPEAPLPPAARPTARATATPVSDGPPVIVPGHPGESAVTRAGSDVRPDVSPGYNDADVSFVRAMIPHHGQAMEMADLARQRAGDPAVRALAERIRASQGPEVGMLRGWLATRGLPAEATGHGHGSGAMRGMQSPEAMRQLAAVRGADFDRLFVSMMTDHHRGAVAMATDLLRVGADLTLSEFATAVAVEQNVEIDRMRTLLDR